MCLGGVRERAFTQMVLPDLFKPIGRGYNLMVSMVLVINLKVCKGYSFNSFILNDR